MIRRSFHALFVLLGIVLLVFLMFQGIGDPDRMVVGQTGDQKTLLNIRQELNLDKPVWKQLMLYLNDVSPISINTTAEIDRKELKGLFIGGEHKLGIKFPYLGRSYQTRRPVVEMLMQVLPATIILAVAAMLFAIITGVLLGILAAVKKGTWLDTSTVFASVAGISAPSFFMAIIIAYIFGILLQPFTGLNFSGNLFEVNEVSGKPFLALKNLVLPAITLGIRPLAIICQLTRSTMLNELQKDYIRTAYAKGLSKSKVLFKHALPNAINPVITVITGWFAELLAGAFFVEYIFGWNGLGKVTVNALEKLDYPVVMGAVLISACLFLLINIFTDMLYRWFDPRVR
jgi:peptide/nickel transport system permease protein